MKYTKLKKRKPDAKIEKSQILCILFFQISEKISDMTEQVSKFDLDTPIWDQNTFSGRRRFYAWITDPRNTIVSTATLYQARDLIQCVR